ncbi:MAG: hypothetical protein CM15mP127_05760 [Gammaproteobacteria bacterium]|nr:MAG: hypothetical protein CM15mP127_05760 [Gammaproteobacteria bacterium]
MPKIISIYINEMYVSLHAFCKLTKNIYDIMFGTVLSDFALYPELSNAQIKLLHH